MLTLNKTQKSFYKINQSENGSEELSLHSESLLYCRASIYSFTQSAVTTTGDTNKRQDCDSNTSEIK